MGYRREISVNPANGSIEKVIAEGSVGDRPWAVLECVPQVFGMEHYASDLFLQCQLPTKVLRISCADFDFKSYLSLFVADWKGLYSELIGLKSPNGREYCPRFGLSLFGMWKDNPGENGELYVETILNDENPPAEWPRFNQIAHEFTEALAPILLRIAAAGPIQAEGEKT